MKNKLLLLCLWMMLMPFIPSPKALGISAQLSPQDTQQASMSVQVSDKTYNAVMDCYRFDGGEGVSADSYDHKVSILMIPGANHNRKAFAPLMSRIAKRRDIYGAVDQVCALDLPGHGGSQLPMGTRLSNLGLDTYVTFVRQLLSPDLWIDQGFIPPTRLVGHSLGGLVIQLLWQDSPSPSGTGIEQPSLDSIGGVLLMAPTLPEEIYWETGNLDAQDLDSDFLLQTLRLLAVRPDLGLHIAFPPDLFQEHFLSCAPEDFSLKADPASAGESVKIWLEIYGYYPDSAYSRNGRPSVAPGTFEDINLVTLSFQDDPYMSQYDIQNLHRHLAGIEDSDYVPEAALHAAGDPGSCIPHDAFYLDPEQEQLTQAMMALIN